MPAAAILLATAIQLAVPAVVFLLLVGLSALLAAGEAALTTAPAHYRRSLGFAPPAPERALSPPDEPLAAVQAGRRLANVAAGGVGAGFAILATPLGPWPAAAAGLGVAWLVLVVAGEGARRWGATPDPGGADPDLTGPIQAALAVLGPVVRVARALPGLGGSGDPPGRALYDEREFEHVVEAGEARGVLEGAEGEMISAVIAFGDEDVGDVMAPRTDVVAVEAETPVEEVATLVTDTGYSRIPVYRGDLDDVVGVVYAKDLLDAVREDPKARVDSVVKEALFVPETTPLDEVLREMKTRRIHVGIVHDEFGGTAGLVTLEDLLEEIVGDIFDEYDPEVQDVEWLADDEAILDARMDVERVNEELDVRLPSEPGYETLGGFLFHKLGRPGRSGEVVEHEGIEFTLERVANRRILKVRVAWLDEPTPED